MADTQVDWGKLAEGAWQATSAMRPVDALGDWLRETIEPLVKAAKPLKAFIAKYDERARAGLDDVLYSVDGDLENGIKASNLRALRAALDKLPKIK